MKTLKSLMAALAMIILSEIPAKAEDHVAVPFPADELTMEMAGEMNSPAKSKKVLVEVDYIIDSEGRPYVTYIKSTDARVNAKIISMIENAEWPLDSSRIESVQSMQITVAL